ncbi:hypothetical protein, partial [Pseudomonas viridiflava]|uniref:hypothetical protein n=1 Tax=Pseudomonas viridiflava TaxID=33069 RepID=UPI00197E5BC2
MTTGYSYAGTTDAKNTYADAARSQEVGLLNQLASTREKTAAELTYLDAKGLLRLNSEQQGLANIGGPAIY